MRRSALIVAVVLATAGLAQARGIVIPVDKTLPPLAMLNHHVKVTIEDQVATTTVEQTFRNHTARPLEATYVFPVPKGASVRKFSMWVNDKEVAGELVDAPKAKEIYTNIVRQTQDPGLLEYMGTDLLRLQVFPIPANGDQKVKVEYSSVAKKEHEIIEYTYPLKTDGKVTATLEDFSLKMTLKSQDPISNIYSPTHSIAINRLGEQEVTVTFDKAQSLLDKDFQVYYTTSGKDVGMTALLHRPLSAEDGFFMLLMSPRADLAKSQQVPRDLVFVLDTSGSMLQDGKIDQAKRALRHGLDGLTEKDRFAVINFATTVNRYKEGLAAASKDEITNAKTWVEKLNATGGTAINDALNAALDLQSKDEGRVFTVVFFTDGKPTIGETNPDKILANVSKKNTANTRIFTFGVGHDLNAMLLDQLADQSRAASSYVRPEEDMEVKVSAFFGKISHPVLANLKISAGMDVNLLEVYPPHLPDLFHGDQLVVLGRYHGSGKATVKLTGTLGKETREYTYDGDFATKANDKPFVEDLWARRKVGYLLEQIRVNGDKKELVDEVTALAKKYGIATPYTSYLIVPDAPVPVAGRGLGGVSTSGVTGAGFGGGFVPAEPPVALQPIAPGAAPVPVRDFAKGIGKDDNGLARERDKLEQEKFKENKGGGKSGSSAEGKPDGVLHSLRQAEATKKTLDEVRINLETGAGDRNHINKLGVDLSVCVNNLKCQERLQQSAIRRVGERNCLEVGGVWVDDQFNSKMPIVTVKAMSDAYFRMLELHPEMKEVFRLGNHLVWVTPNGSALVIDLNDGKDKLSDEEINKLFVVAKAPK